MRRASLAAALLLAASPAVAHVRLTSPVSRYGDEQKVGPCGRFAGARSANVTAFLPGQAITVTFDELIDHPGWFRIAFDPAGDAALAPPSWDAAALDFVEPQGVLVLADRIPNPAGLTHGAVPVTLPDVLCSACTLQVVQVMTDKPPYDGLDDFYYQCADLVLTLTPGDVPPPPPSPPPAAPTMPGGGCSSGGAAPEVALLAALALLAATRRGRGGPFGRR